MLVDTPESKAFEQSFDGQADQVSPSAIDDMFGDRSASGQTTGASSQSPELTNTPTAPVAPSEEDLAERLWWDKCGVLGKIKDCARLIQETEGEIDGYQDQIKEAKEVLKGQQALLARYSSQLADILDGHPLPKNPNAAADGADTGAAAGSAAATDKSKVEPGTNWRATATCDLLYGIKGMGPKKLDGICSLAPTVGHLEDLRGQASIECKPFKDVLPKGCGEELCSAIEERLLDHMAKMPGDDEATGDEATGDDPDGELRDELAEALLPMTGK